LRAEAWRIRAYRKVTVTRLQRVYDAQWSRTDARNRNCVPKTKGIKDPN